MKTLLCLALLLPTMLWAQVDTTAATGDSGTVVIDSKKLRKRDTFEMKTLASGTDHGGFGALMLNYGEVAGEGALLAGVRGGWIINHSFSIGAAGYGTTTNLENNGSWQYDSRDTNSFSGIGYGGLVFEPIFFPRQAVHFTVPVLVGAGGAWYTQEYPRNPGLQNDKSLRDSRTISSAFFVIEPGINLELNVTRFFRTAISAQYRIVSSLDSDFTRFSADELSGWHFGLTFKFGSF